jgi:hypothetical protein
MIISRPPGGQRAGVFAWKSRRRSPAHFGGKAMQTAKLNHD